MLIIPLFNTSLFLHLQTRELYWFSYLKKDIIQWSFRLFIVHEFVNIVYDHFVELTLLFYFTRNLFQECFERVLTFFMVLLQIIWRLQWC